MCTFSKNYPFLYNSILPIHDTVIVFDSMDSDPLLCWTELVPFCHLGLSWYFVTVFKDPWIVAKGNKLDAIDLSILKFKPLDFAVDLFFLTIAVFETHCIQLIMQRSCLDLFWIRNGWVVRGLQVECKRSQIPRSPREAPLEGRNAMLERHLVNVHQLIPITSLGACGGRAVRWLHFETILRLGGRAELLWDCLGLSKSLNQSCTQGEARYYL